MALAKGLVLLGIEGLSFQIDLTYLGTGKVQSRGIEDSRRGPFPTFYISHRQECREGCGSVLKAEG